MFSLGPVLGPFVLVLRRGVRRGRGLGRVWADPRVGGLIVGACVVGDVLGLGGGLGCGIVWVPAVGRGRPRLVGASLLVSLAGWWGFESV